MTAPVRLLVSSVTSLQMASVTMRTSPMKTPDSARPVMTAPVYFPGSRPTIPKMLVCSTAMLSPARLGATYPSR